MPIIETFYSRQRRLRGQVNDVYQYDDLPQPLRVQIVQIMYAVVGTPDQFSRISPRPNLVRDAYKNVVEVLRREFGVFQLTDNERNEYCLELSVYIMQETHAEKVLSAVELLWRVIENATCRSDYLNRRNAEALSKDAIEELNHRFKQHGVGYQYVDGEIIRVDSQLIHSEVVLPALKLLNSAEYEGPQEEFLSAFEHYRKGNNKESLNDCLKAFESIMKAICGKRGWHYENNTTASGLIKICLDNGLIPPFWESNVNVLKTLLESGVPTGRNKLSGHGQGPTPVAVPNSVTAHMLHMTAANIVFLATAERELP